LEFAGKNFLVMGIRRSGLAAIELLQQQGARVRAMDARPLAPDEQARLAGMQVAFVRQEEGNLLDAEGVVLSPGVPYDLPLLVEARGRGIPTIAEVELSSYFLKGPIIGITGSNGKTTTTALTGHILRECGIRCQVGGNIGAPVAALVDSSSAEQWNVLELSSFQLEAIDHFHASIAACLNVTPDHLDRHHTFEMYANAKARLFETQRPGDFAVLNRDDATCRTLASRTTAEIRWFSSTQNVPAGVSMDGDSVQWDGTTFMARSQIKLRGLHNVENVMAAAAMAHLAGAKLDEIGRAVSSFPGVEHRIEFVRKLHGVEYYNDSKATNVDAALKAIDAFPQNLWIILGGKDKGSDYTPLRDPLAKRARGALLIGAAGDYPHAAAPLLRNALAGAVPLVDCGTLERAVTHARVHALPGDTVLLAPACASFDQFENYEQRGKCFKHLVAELS
jgi:UDP-N-acetylmuramoylalanine--D-glutamate ligase